MIITKENFHLLKVGMKVIGKNFTKHFTSWNNCIGVIKNISKDYKYICIAFDKEAQGGWKDSSIGIFGNQGRSFAIEDDVILNDDNNINNNLVICFTEYMLDTLKDHI